MRVQKPKHQNEMSRLQTTKNDLTLFMIIKTQCLAKFADRSSALSERDEIFVEQNFLSTLNTKLVYTLSSIQHKAQNAFLQTYEFIYFYRYFRIHLNNSNVQL